MIQVQTELFVADNTGARKVECIKVLGDLLTCDIAVSTLTEWS